MDGPPLDDQPGEQRLERAPSDRYRAVAPEVVATEASLRAGRGAVPGIVAALAGAGAITVAGGLLTMTAGLLVVAAVLGWVVAVALSLDGARAATGRGRRRALAGSLALAGVAVGQLGLWLVARGEGGTLGLLDYLGEVFGVLIPLELALAGAAAWWQAR